MKHKLEINIHQHNENTLVYYDVRVGDWTCDGDALSVESALELIQHHLKYNYTDSF